MGNTVQAVIKVDAAQAQRELNALGALMTKSVASGNLLASGIGNGLQAISNAAAGVISGAVRSFNEAADISLSNIGTAGDMAKLTGMSFADAQKDIAKFTKEMSIAAADLPGDTAGFVGLGVGISDNLVPAFKDLNGQFDAAGFEKYRASLAQAGAMRADFSGISTADSSLAISKMLGGASTAELKSLKFFEANPAVLGFIETALEEKGQDIKDLSKIELVKLADSALGVSDEVIEAARNSTKGIMAGFKSGLLDPNTGMFGIMKDLDTDLEGNQSAYSSIERVVKKIFGSEGLIPTAAQIFTNITGIDSDSPMQTFADGIGKVGGWIDKASKFLGGIAGMTDDSRGFSAIDILGNIGQKLAGWLSEKVNGIFSSGANLDAEGTGKKLGGLLAVGLNAVFKFVADLDMQKIGQTVLNGAIVVATGLVELFKKIEWKPAIEALLSGALAVAVGMGATFLASVAGVSAPVIAAIVTGGAALIAGVESIWDKAKDWLADIRDAVGDVFKKIWDAVNDLFGKVFSGGDRKGSNKSVANRASGGGPMFDALMRESRAMPAGASPVLANSSETILNHAQANQVASGLQGRGSFALNGNIVIHTSATSNPEKLADEVWRAIERKWARFDQSQLAPGYA